MNGQVHIILKRLILLIAVILSCNSISAYDFEVDGLCYNKLSNNQVEVTYKNEVGNSYSGTLVIPEKVKYGGKEYVVSVIGDNAFSRCSGLTGSLVIPNSVTSIGAYAFFYCSGFSGSLTIPNSVISIGKQAFAHCNSLTGSLIIPNSVVTIGYGVFEGCNFTGSLMIPNSITTIEENVFYGCSGFTGSLIIPSSVTSIGDRAFYGCSEFTGSLVIPSSVTSIGSESFYGCRGLTSLVLPSSVTSIGYRTFMYCKKLSYAESQMETPFNFGDDVFLGIASNAILVIPKGESYPYGIVKWFAEIRWTSASYNLSISSSGNGNASYNGTSIRNKTTDFSLTEGTSATITFSPDNGFRVKSVKVNNSAVSVSNNQYTISSINANTTVSVEFEAIPATTYTLSITVKGNGSASYDGTTIKDETKSLTVPEGGNATITLSPDDGYKVNIAKIDGNFSSNLNDNALTISNIKSNLIVEIEFLAIPSYTLSIKALGNGSVTYDGAVIRGKTSSFTAKKGTSAKILFTPDDGYQIKAVMVNGSTVSVSNNEYTISSINMNTMVEVEFEKILQVFSVDDVNYTVVSVNEQTIRLAKGSYGITLMVPAKVSFQDVEWTVTGVDNGALANIPDLAAIIWHPEAAFTEQVSNPNLLLYVDQNQYAPTTIKNVVVNGNANSITLTDAASGNNFHCPQEFTAQKISYTHNYSMETGIGEAKGWETIALPFDVQKVAHESKGEIVSFANWRSSGAKKPFWLMQLSGSGWTMATSIKANTPYIISMPKNDEYKAGFWLNGRVTFSAENVDVPKTENLSIANYSDRTFVPSFSGMEMSNDVFTLNVVNDIECVAGGMTEGSTFVKNLRPVHPFEAYMTTSSSATRSIDISEGMTTDIYGVKLIIDSPKSIGVYNLNGQRMNVKAYNSEEELKRCLPLGVYIVDGKKYIKK